MCIGGEPRKVVELYNLTRDYTEQRNLAREPEYRHHLQELQHWATQLIQEMVREEICTITICRSCSTGQHNSYKRW
jgi:hypothetical protein